jgi:hypothetical protein
MVPQLPGSLDAQVGQRTKIDFHVRSSERKRYISPPFPGEDALPLVALPLPDIFRRLLRDYETSESSVAAWAYIAMIRIQIRRLA